MLGVLYYNVENGKALKEIMKLRKKNIIIISIYRYLQVFTGIGLEPIVTKLKIWSLTIRRTRTMNTL